MFSSLFSLTCPIGMAFMPTDLNEADKSIGDWTITPTFSENNILIKSFLEDQKNRVPSPLRLMESTFPRD